MSHDHTAPDPSCREVVDLLSDFVDGELSHDLQEALAKHLSACPPCERFLKTFKRTKELCRQDLSEEMPKELKNRLRTFLRDRLPRK